MDPSILPIIVTRAEPGAGETLARLEQMELTAISSPVLTLELIPDVELAHPSTLSGLVFTSANGVRCYAERSLERRLTAWCVGPATARAARDAGFTDVQESAGNAIDLARFVAAHAQPTTQPMLHVVNAAAKGNLKREMAALGFSVEICPLYHMRPATALSDAANTALTSGGLALVLVHSAKGAEAFAQLAQSLTLKAIGAVAISEQATAPLADLDLSHVQIAAVPNEDGLLDALRSAIATLSA